MSKWKWSLIATVLPLYPLWLGQKTRPKCNTKTNRCLLFPALWAVCLASLIVLIGSFYSCTWDRDYLYHIACQPASPRVRQSKMAPNARNRMASRSFPFGLVHKNPWEWFPWNDTISMRSPSSNVMIIKVIINNNNTIKCHYNSLIGQWMNARHSWNYHQLSWPFERA